MAKGTRDRSPLDKAKGPVATLLIQNGTLRAGDVLAADPSFARCARWWMTPANGSSCWPFPRRGGSGLSAKCPQRDEFDGLFCRLRRPPAAIVVVTGPTLARATRLAQQCFPPVSLASMSGQASEGELKELNLILKADVQGSVERDSRLALRKQTAQRRMFKVCGCCSRHPARSPKPTFGSCSASGAVIVGLQHLHGLQGPRRRPIANGVDVRALIEVIYKLLEDIQVGRWSAYSSQRWWRKTLGEKPRCGAVFKNRQDSRCRAVTSPAEAAAQLQGPGCNRAKQVVFEGDLTPLASHKDRRQRGGHGFRVRAAAAIVSPNWQGQGIASRPTSVSPSGRTLSTN